MSAADPAPDAIVELRQYTLQPGRRDTLIELFEQRFLEAHDAVDAHVLGTFRDLDDPQRFVWLRGFASMNARFDALTAFYGGAAWRAHRDEANATMRDSDNVLLLKSSGAPRDAGHATEPGAFLALIHDLRAVDVDAFVSLFDAVGPALTASAGGVVAATLVTEPGANTFTRLPVRADERVHVCFVRFSDVDALDAGAHAFGPANALRDAAPDALLPAFMRRPERLRLVPTARSRWR